jgi:hypothetical protein
LDGGNFLREIIVDSALAFAQEVPHRKHLDYAATMEGNFHGIQSKPRVSVIPGQILDSSRIGFRWEEGISEWVTVTPSIGISKCMDLKEFTRADQTPFRPPPRQRSVREVGLLPGRARDLRSFVSIAAPGVSNASSPRDNYSISEHSHESGDEPSQNSSESEADDFDDYGDEVVTSSSPAVESSNYFQGSGDELVNNFPEDGFSNEPEDSGDELRPSSPQSGLLNKVKRSDNVLLSSSPRSENYFVDESFTSVISSAVSYEGSEHRSGRRHIDRVPRLSKRILRRSLQWQLFDDSDDELSFVSVSSQDDSVLQEVTNRVSHGTRRLRQRTAAAKKQKSFAGFDDSLADSEDELCS